MKGRACWAFIPFRDAPEGKERPCVVLEATETKAIVAYGTSTDRGPPQERFQGPPSRVAALWMERPGGRGLRNDTFFYPSNVSAVELSRVKPGRLLPPSDFQRVWLLTAPGRAQIAVQVLAAAQAQAASASKPEPPKG